MCIQRDANPMVTLPSKDHCHHLLDSINTTPSKDKFIVGLNDKLHAMKVYQLMVAHLRANQ